MTNQLENPRHPTELYNRLWRAYGCFQGDGESYIQTHLKRFCATLDLVPPRTGLKILELGTSAPFHFSLMLRAKFPDVQLFINHEDTTNLHQHIILHASTNSDPDITLPCAGYNIETTSWPHASDQFDVVLLTEVLEHLLLNPIAVFSEAMRVLAPGGRFIVTTPNIACLEAVQSLLELRSPYTYGVYSKHGPYGRHNREYVPSELEKLGRACGFDTELLTTKDCYGLRCDVSNAQAFLRESEAAGLGGTSSLRGQTIFYVGRKANTPPGPFPLELFDYNPLTHRSRIALAPESPAPILFENPPAVEVELAVFNEGSLTWKPGPDETRIGLQLLSADGVMIARDWLRFELASAVAPGESARIRVRSDLPDLATKLPGFIFRFDMVHEFVCWFSDVPTGGKPFELRFTRRGDESGWDLSP